MKGTYFGFLPKQTASPSTNVAGTRCKKNMYTLLTAADFVSLTDMNLQENEKDKVVSRIS